jgi:piezo-type mechanosensitive ion channel component 1/2
MRDHHYRLTYDEISNPNYVLRLCLGVYLAREVRDLRLEEDLFARLLFLHRCPDALFRVTKHKMA